MVCESLINSDTLEWERTQLWALTFKLVRKIIGGVDYKVLFLRKFGNSGVFYKFTVRLSGVPEKVLNLSLSV